MQAFDVDPDKVNVNGGVDRHGPPAGRHRRDHHRHPAGRAGTRPTRKPGWPRCASPPAWARPRSSSGCDAKDRPRRKPSCSTASSYPAPYAAMMDKRAYPAAGRRGRADAVRREHHHSRNPAAKSSLRHWHLSEDEFVMVTQGEVVLVEDSGETPMRAGEFAAFPAGGRERPSFRQPLGRRGAVPGHRQPRPERGLHLYPRSI